MSEETLAAITEHVLHSYQVGPINAPDMQLFRAPVTTAPGGSAQRFPHRVEWEDLQADDIVLAIELHVNPEILPVVEVWRVIEKIDDDVVRVWANKIVGKGKGAEDVRDRLRGLVRAE